MKLKAIILLAFITFSFTQCNKDSKDLTASIVGKYTNPSDHNLEITVNKIDDNTVTLTLQNSYFDYAFTNVKMNSATSFSLNELNKSGICYTSSSTSSANVKITGTGTGSNSNISVFVTETVTATSGSCTETNNYTFSASK